MHRPFALLKLGENWQFLPFMAKANKFSIKFSFQSEFLICLSMLCVYFLEYLLSSFYTDTLTKKNWVKQVYSIKKFFVRAQNRTHSLSERYGWTILNRSVDASLLFILLEFKKKKYIDQYNFIALFFQILSHCVLELLHNRNQLYLSTLVNKISIKV